MAGDLTAEQQAQPLEPFLSHPEAGDGFLLGQLDRRLRGSQSTHAISVAETRCVRPPPVRENRIVTFVDDLLWRGLIQDSTDAG